MMVVRIREVVIVFLDLVRGFFVLGFVFWRVLFWFFFGYIFSFGTFERLRSYVGRLL